MDSLNLRWKYRHFRILVIGRANAGKTTLLKRVCNTTEEPCIYDEQNKNLLEPTADRGIHDIHRPFAFRNNPEFIFHDSPGFEKGGEKELRDVQQFIEDRAKATEVDDQLHAIWFCVVTDASRPLLELERRFFNEKHSGNVPVIAVFTKFDELVTQLCDIEKEDDENRETAVAYLQDKFEQPLVKSKYPPKAHLSIEEMQEEHSNHQTQVKELMHLTADSLDSLALKLLFVSVQQNNLELCVKYAVRYTQIQGINLHKMVKQCLQWFQHAYWKDHNYGHTEYDAEERYEREHGARFADARDYYRHEIEEAEAQLAKNSELATKIMSDSPFHEQLSQLAVLCVCFEHSFWLMSEPQSLSFKEAFQNGLRMLTGDQEKMTNLQISLDNLTPGPMNQKETIMKVILANRLSHPGDQ